MATYYIDYEGGNNANDGTTFANRWKTIPGGATSARIAAGDTIRIMASPDETLIGDATWTNLSKTVTLASAVNSTIATCEVAWTASTNVTTSTNSSPKEGSNHTVIAVATAFTTGLCAYFATGTLDLSTYQQVSFWFYASANIAASTLSLRLCTDTAGAVPVHTIAIPAIGANSNWMPITVDLGANMNSAIQSIALYQDSDISAVTVHLDNIIACKASSSADALSLTSLIGKVWNRSWVASSTYAANDIRIPTQPNRNGYRYKVTAGGGGAAGSTEPTWPTEIGTTVTDGALTWTCEGLEDTWYGIQSISGATIKLDNSTGTTSSGGRGYYGTTETVSTYKRETIKMDVSVGAQNLQKSGTASSYITYSGGWNRTDMSTQTGQTWFDQQNCAIPGLSHTGLIQTNGNAYNLLSNINIARSATCFNDSASYNKFRNCHCTNSSSAGLYDRAPIRLEDSVIGFNSSNGAVAIDFAPDNSVRVGFQYKAVAANNCIATGGAVQDGASYTRLRGKDIFLANNSNFALGLPLSPNGTSYFCGLVTSDNGSAACNIFKNGMFLNCKFAESIIFNTVGFDSYVWSHRHQQIANNHLGTTDGGTISSATDQRHTASGISWKFKPTQTVRGPLYPLSLSVAKVACAANTAVTVKIWCYRDNANIVGKLMLKGGQLPGLPEDISVVCTPTINTWEQSGALTFTPTESGVVEILFQVYDGVGTTNSFWVDDISFS